jgi:2-polyprenyl-6-methoxyphenol hydroxylase-like FAD-dependent oxidoreductase
MFERKKPEVLIVGAGPVGMFAALVLAKRGVRVKIVDSEWRTGAHSYALALHPQSLRLLDEAGVLGDVLQHAYHVRTMGLYEGATRRDELHITDLREDFSFIASIRQDVLEDILEKALHSLDVKVQWNHQVITLLPEDDHVVATIDRLEQSSFGYSIAHSEWIVAKSQTVEVPFVIGADGHQSRVRRALGIDFKEVGPPQHFAVFEFKTDADLVHEMRLIFEEDRTNVLWPLPDGHCRWSFQLDDFEAGRTSREKDRLEMQIGETRYPVLTEDHLRELLNERAPWFDGSIDEIRWRLVVRFDRRLATSFGQGRMWLAGDAGHMTSPAGIQSMNVGLLEARDLANTVADILKGTASINRLADYNHARLEAWQFLLGLEGGLQPGPGVDPWIRRYADQLLPCLPASGEDLAALAHQVGLEAIGNMLTAEL